jgi:hypothetical protein
VPYNIAEFSTQVSVQFTTCYFLLLSGFIYACGFVKFNKPNYLVTVKFSSFFGS